MTDMASRAYPSPAEWQFIGHLQRAGLIEERERGREGTRPERTTYAITADGRDALLARLREMIATPEEALPRLAAGLTFIARLEPEDAAAHLERRAAGLREEVAALASAQDGVPADLPRIYYIELEYALTLRRAELDWIEGVVADVRDGRLTWTTDVEAPA
jgi:hypothetical protein